MKYYISPQIREQVERHLFSNLLVRDSESPLIMGIFGPTGEGKTFQLIETLKEMGINIIDISAGELENENSGFPAEMLRLQYLEASKASDPTVMVINDIDAIIGKWGNLTQYTVNRQNVSVQLMHFCENPYDVAGHTTKRIPIFVTGNNPSVIYEPLRRPGRMRIVEWVPSEEDKIKIVANIFPDIPLSEISDCVKKWKERPVSFWSDIASEVKERKLYEYLLGSYSRRHLKQLLKSGPIISMDEVVISKSDFDGALNRFEENTANKNYLLGDNY